MLKQLSMVQAKVIGSIQWECKHW